MRRAPVQEFSVFSSRIYSESFARQALGATWRLFRAMRSGVSARTVLSALLQIPGEMIGGDGRVPQRAMLQSYIFADAFKTLYARYRPAFATLHLNNVATCSTATGGRPSRSASGMS